MSDDRDVGLAPDRPHPPAALLDPEIHTASFVPAPALLRWVTATLLAPGGPIHNPDHLHLVQPGEDEGDAARILWIWTSAEWRRHGRLILGQTDLVTSTQRAWSKARPTDQLATWWLDDPGRPAVDPEDDTPDFAITLYAPWCAEASDAAFLSLIEHELYHCGQAVDDEGEPRYLRGRPAWCIKGHDVEEHLGVVRRYGAVDPAVRELVRLASAAPEVSAADIAVACGTCAR